MPKDGDMVFPLKRHYGMANFTFEGIGGMMPSEEIDFDLPDYPDEDPDQSGEDPTGEQDQGGVDPTTKIIRSLERSRSITVPTLWGVNTFEISTGTV